MVNSYLRIRLSTCLAFKYIIYIFTDINEILEIIDKSQKKISGYALKITHIAAAGCRKLPNWALN